jgi:hypothetical protein
MQITTIGLDIAKNVFQVHGIDAAENVVVRKQLRRGQVLKFFAARPPCLVGMEACATAHYCSVIAAQAREPNSGLIVMPDGFMNVHRAEVTSLADRWRLPAVYPFRFFAELGGLLCYGNEQRDQFRLAATYVDRVLRGGRPSDLPVQAPVRFELVINLKTAKTLGLDVPVQLQQRADDVIE